MTSTIVTLLAIILLLAFVFFKTKAASKKPGQFHNDGRRKTFKDFQKEQLENDPDGVYGEAATFKTLTSICNDDGRKFVLMKNLYSPSHGGTTEIDALLLHQSGIYVLETKNISGEITGTLEEERWHQRLNARTTHTFHNPIQQNAGHIRALRHFLKENFSKSDLNVDELPVFSAIVFSDRCVLKGIPTSPKVSGSSLDVNWIILHIFQLQKKLSNIIKNQKTILETEQLESLYWKLKPCAMANEKTKAEHRAYIQSKHR